jgi:hypothetical protein
LVNTCGIDWSERHHDVAIVNQDGTVAARARITHDLTRFAVVFALSSRLATRPQPPRRRSASRTGRPALTIPSRFGARSV